MSYEPKTGILSTFEFLCSLEDYPTVRTKDNTEYLNIPAAFDIEVSSFYDHGEKRATMYIWQLGVYNLVTCGRTWEEFRSTVQALQQILRLNEHRRLIIYVHNLAYEFQFIRKHFMWDNVFLLEERKPVYARTDGVEFRCSLKLAGGRSLAAVAKDLARYPVEKLVGDLDYSLVRSSLTGLSMKELHYCENDIRVILHYIQEKIENDGDISKIPLTNTSYVRHYCRKECKRNREQYRSLMSILTVAPDEYKLLKHAFQGGFTHANPAYVDKVLEGVRSYDLQSSYPAVMVLRKFPMSNGVRVDTTIPFDENSIQTYLERYCCLFDVDFYDLEPKLEQDNPISESKCTGLDPRQCLINNGRVVRATHLKTTCTELDFQTYCDFYTFSRCEITNLYTYKPGYLPKPIVESILKFYADKTKLKGVPGQELNYMISKNMLNAAYGMMVTAIVRDEIQYTPANLYAKLPADIAEAIEKYNNSLNRFLFYPWGVWVTAHARRILFRAIKECGMDHVYSDTDSEKILNYERHVQWFSDYQNEVEELIKASSQHFNIPESQYRPTTPAGNEYVIGVWGDEGMYDKFKTLGAKRYLTYKNGKYDLTAAGVNKKKATSYLSSLPDPFSAFNNNLCVPIESSGRNILTYIDDETEGDYIDYLSNPFHYHELSSIHMEGSDYNFSRSDAFINFLAGIKEVQIDGIR